MNRKLEVITATLTAIGVIVAIVAWIYPVSSPSALQNSDEQSSRASRSASLIERLLPDAVLSVSGTGAMVKIRKSQDGRRYGGGNVTATGATSVVYLPLGQSLRVEITGTGSVVAVESELMPYIQVNNVATGGKLIEF